MKKFILLLLIVMAAVVTVIDRMEASSSVPLFFYDFENGAVWGKSLDGSVNCSACLPAENDLAVYPSYNWPGHNTVMTLHANVGNEPCIVTNCIASRPVPYHGGGNYQIELDMRQWRYDGVYQLHQTDTNLTWCKYDHAVVHVKTGKKTYYYKDRFTEVGIFYNSDDSSLNGWLYYKSTGTAVTKILDLRTNPNWKTDWHHIIVNNYVDDANNIFILESIYCDGRWIELHVEMPVFWHAVSSIGGWSANFTCMVESANRYTGCSFSTVYQGIGIFDNIRATFFPW